MDKLHFPAPIRSEAAEQLRQEVRDFLQREIADRPVQDRAGGMTSRDHDFSRKVGAQGWIGLTWPKEHGGQERSALERYVLLEEMLAAGAPVGAHWTADRQSGPLLLKFGTEKQKRDILPRITAGECYFCIGMSEPDSGSDLAAARTRADPTEGGYIVNGTKIWTSNAHLCHYMILFCRTDTKSEDKHGGVSQFLVDLKSPGITIRPIYDMAGNHHFNEVVFTDAFLPADTLIGTEGGAWKQVTKELAYERSGPERFLSSLRVLQEMVRELKDDQSDHAAITIGRLTAHMITLRRLSRSVAAMLENGEDPALQAALVKDLGTTFEQETVEAACKLTDVEPDYGSKDGFSAVVGDTMMRAPGFSIRGGTREVLRGMIARGLGLR